MRLDDFQDGLQRFSSVKSVEEITGLCDSYCKLFGFDTFVYALRVPEYFAHSKLVIVDGYPSSWVNHYFERSFYDADPVMEHCLKHIVPIEWCNIRVEEGSTQELMMNEAGEFGLKSGVTMPIHSPHGELGVLSFALDRFEPAAKDTTRYAMPYIQLLASYMHEALRRISGLDSGSKEQPPLSAREKECLKWAADGKSAWEIGNILHISERTVNFHLNNIVQKLGVTNRQHAVAKATLKGIIQPTPSNTCQILQ
jgi:DNA-binding CsgD family transcriptional regulator